MKIMLPIGWGTRLVIYSSGKDLCVCVCVSEARQKEKAKRNNYYFIPKTQPDYNKYFLSRRSFWRPFCAVEEETWTMTEKKYVAGGNKHEKDRK